jgi:hypothetical protein
MFMETIPTKDELLHPKQISFYKLKVTSIKEANDLSTLDITLFGKLEEHTRAHGFGKA